MKAIQRKDAQDEVAHLRRLLEEAIKVGRTLGAYNFPHGSADRAIYLAQLDGLEHAAEAGPEAARPATGPLAYGEAPFDRWGVGELRLYAKRSYAALVSARTALALLQGDREASPFWSDGTGGRALAGVLFAMEAHGLDPRMGEELYRGYYRNAGPPLFKGCVTPVGNPTHDPWWACDRCENMIGQVPGRPAPTACIFCEGGPPLRELTLADVEGWRFRPENRAVGGE